MGLTTLSHGGTEHSVLERPTKTQAVQNAVVVRAVYLDPFAQRLANSVQVLNAIRALVAVLFFVRSPFAIFWRVWAVIVDAVKSMPVRRVSHVGKEILKAAMRIFPSLANSDAARPVISVTRLLRLKAPSPHINPYAVCATFCQTVGSCSFAGELFYVATAGFNPAGCKRITTDNRFLPADTSAVPARGLVFSRGRNPDNSETVKSAPCQINKVRAFLVSEGSFSASSHRAILPPVRKLEVKRG